MAQVWAALASHHLRVHVRTVCKRFWTGRSRSFWSPPRERQSGLIAFGGAVGVAALARHWRFSACEAADQCPSELRGKADAFGGLILDPAELPAAAEDFKSRLECSLDAWRNRGVRGVWMNIPIQKAHLIGIAVDLGFVFHHAERDYCMLTHWLPLDEANPLPPNASTQVGVGALVVNYEGKVLLVQEAVGPSSGKNIWKIPTGLLNAREDIQDGAVRECEEETGVAADFEKVLAFRHSHQAMFGKSDLFFVCLLRPKVAQPSFRLQQGEIAAAKWGDFHEFLQQAPYPRDTPVWAKFYGSCIGEDGVPGNVPGICAERLPLNLQPNAPRNFVYF